MKHGSLKLLFDRKYVLFGFLTIGISASSAAHADSSLGKCTHEAVKFDGTRALMYAEIVGPPGSRVVLCKEGGERKCTASTYLRPGDAIAIASRCGAFAHVQFIGTEKIFEGWVKNEDISERVTRVSPNPSQPPYSYVFRLTKGKGVPVCEAYLQRLNTSGFDFSHRPYCGRPEDDSVPGFTKLIRVPLKPAEINRLYKLAYNFEFPPGQFEKDGPIRTGKVNVTAEVGHGLEAWGYDPPVDVFNDGVPRMSKRPKH